ncbi:BLUF domain-containing protein [Limnohabitans sp. DCL3]|uniref:BLUF domain-containing protein n=1 Tax=Limnohabitans sp. DCL3 TaxID=3374103 RepID=UPI003A83820E
MRVPSHSIMVRLLYVSRAVGPQTTTMTSSILAQAHAHNPAQAITGVLCQGQGFFIQVIEGERSRIHALYRRICADNRHKDVEILHHEEIQARRFGQWSMALVHLSVDDPMVRLQHPDFDPYSASGPQVMRQVMDLLEAGQPIQRPVA